VQHTPQRLSAELREDLLLAFCGIVPVFGAPGAILQGTLV
jgi:hypothetical protein